MILLKKYSGILLAALLMIQLQGCTVIYWYYFRNHSSQPVTITIAKSSDVDFTGQSQSVWLEKAIIPINAKTPVRFSDSLPLLPAGGNNVYFTVPAQSTIMLPRSAMPGSYYGGQHNIVIRQHNQADTVTWQNGRYQFPKTAGNRLKLFSKGGLLVKNIWCIDYR